MATKQTQFDACNAGVIPTRTHGMGIWNGRRVSVNIRIDEKLYKATKPIMQRYFGSVCGAIEPYLATLYSMATTHKLSGESGVIPSVTINIGKQEIARHVKKVRRKFVEEETEVTETVQAVGCSFCQKTAVAIYEDKLSNIRKYACRFHGGLLESHPKWLFIHAI